MPSSLAIVTFFSTIFEFLFTFFNDFYFAFLLNFSGEFLVFLGLVFSLGVLVV